MECCICYDTSGIYNTKCSHNLCLNCLLKLKKTTCPYCRQELKLPDDIKSIIQRNNYKKHSPYVYTGNLDIILNIYVPSSILTILNQIKNLSIHKYNQLITNINNEMSYDEAYLREVYDDLYQENRNITRITSTYWIDLEPQHF
jgi:hypothetical protein